MCPEAFHSLYIFKGWNLLAGLSPGHTNSSAIYIQEAGQSKRPLLTIYLWSQSSVATSYPLWGNLKRLYPSWIFHLWIATPFESFFFFSWAKKWGGRHRAGESIEKEGEDTAGDARALSNPGKVNRWGWESKRRRMGRGGRAGAAAYRPLQGQKKGKISILSLSLSLFLCLVLSLHQLILFRLLLFLCLHPFQSRKLNQQPFMFRVAKKKKKRKCLGRKKKGGSEN